MKVKRIVFIVLGWLFLLFQAISYLALLTKSQRMFDEHDFPYVLGRNFFAILGILFLIMANRQKLKIRRKKQQELLQDFLVQQ